MTRTALLLLALAACRSEAPARDFGRRLFSDPRLSASTANVVSCATCHAGAPGGALDGVLGRESYWGGWIRDPFDAVNFCFVQFMQGVPPLERDDPRAKALYEYLATLGEGPAQPFTIVDYVEDVPRGDPAVGARVYEAACATCHGATHTGKGKNRASTPTLPEVSASYAELFPSAAPSLVVIEKVRHGQFFRVGGNMPPYSLEALPDEELGALLAFLEL